jgi:hypothetical protein
MTTRDEIENRLKQFTPEQQHFAKAFATMKLENKMLREGLAKANEAYESIFKPFLVIVHASEGKELRIHKSQFLRFKDEYRIDSRFDEETEEMVFSLKTLKDA